MNDVYTMLGMLTEEFQFSVDHITVLADAPHPAAQSEAALPTGENIKRHLSRLVAASQPGDILFLHFSGHGTQVLHRCSPFESVCCCCANLMARAAGRPGAELPYEDGRRIAVGHVALALVQ